MCKMCLFTLQKAVGAEVKVQVKRDEPFLIWARGTLHFHDSEVSEDYFTVDDGHTLVQFAVTQVRGITYCSDGMLLVDL